LIRRHRKMTFVHIEDYSTFCPYIGVITNNNPRGFWCNKRTAYQIVNIRQILEKNTCVW
jgi:hypothetical protein